MLIYTDVFSNDEMFSDAYPIKEIDDVVFEVDSALITVKDGEVDIGANASAEEAAEELDDNAQTVNAVAHAFRLQETSFDKKSYLTYLKGYMKKVKTHLQEADPERVAVFEKNIEPYVKKIIKNFNDYEFFTGESMDPDSMVALLNYREDGVTPYFVFFKDGLKLVKV